MSDEENDLVDDVAAEEEEDEGAGGGEGGEGEGGAAAAPAEAEGEDGSAGEGEEEEEAGSIDSSEVRGTWRRHGHRRSDATPGRMLPGASRLRTATAVNGGAVHARTRGQPSGWWHVTL